MTSTENLLRRIRGEYLEMAGLRLTPDQASRLWGLSLSVSAALLDELTDNGFLARTKDGAYRLSA
jgi:hypothetical protein